MLSLTALVFSRLPRPRLLDAYLALMLAYGVGNLVNDDWLEQVVKRGWTNHEVPSILTPAAPRCGVRARHRQTRVRRP